MPFLDPFLLARAWFPWLRPWMPGPRLRVHIGLAGTPTHIDVTWA